MNIMEMVCEDQWWMEWAEDHVHLVLRLLSLQVVLPEHYIKLMIEQFIVKW
jgi:hypothetical protein